VLTAVIISQLDFAEIISKIKNRNNRKKSI
jgi:hypothetical protein